MITASVSADSRPRSPPRGHDGYAPGATGKGPSRSTFTSAFGPSERVIMLIAVGYADPDGIIPFSQKKGLGVLRSFNQIGG